MEPIYGIPPDLIRGPESDVRPLAGEANWGVAKFKVDRLRSVSGNGAGVTACIVDTGVDDLHRDLAGRGKAKSFINGQTFKDGNGHGTHCTGTVCASDPNIGMAPAANWLHGKGLSNQGSGGGDGIAAALRWGDSEGAEVFSMSLGSSSPDSRIIEAMAELAAKGKWIIAAAGNSGGGTNNVDWPGQSEHCLSVAALNPDLSPASFTSAGDKIDTAFAGVNIWSLRPGGGYAQMSGTSMATPGACGVLLLWRAALKLRGLRAPTVYEMRDILFQRSTDTHSPGDDRRTGPGWVDPILLALGLEPDPPPIVP